MELLKIADNQNMNIDRFWWFWGSPFLGHRQFGDCYTTKVAIFLAIFLGENGDNLTTVGSKWFELISGHARPFSWRSSIVHVGTAVQDRNPGDAGRPAGAMLKEIFGYLFLWIGGFLKMGISPYSSIFWDYKPSI